MKNPYFIIIRGPLGIGKSTIATLLAKKLDAEYISVDKVLEQNGLDKEDNNYTPEDYIKVNKILMPQAKKSLSARRTLIFDGCFYFKEQIENLIESLKTKHYVFTLKAPVKVCIARDARRKQVYGKEAAQAVHCLVSKFDYGISIDTNNKTSEEVVQEILKKLK